MFKYHPFDIPESNKIRLIINTDAKNEADDQFAIVHALLTPRFHVKGIIAAHFGKSTSMQESYAEVVKLLGLMNFTQDDVKVYKGSERAVLDEQPPAISEGAEIIISEALADDPRPLYVIFLGPLTDLATAYLTEPSIAGRLVAVWVGGGAWPNGGSEYNLSNDINAANVIFSSDIPLWVIPMNVYVSNRVSIAELAIKVKPFGEIGKYLYQQLVDYHGNEIWRWNKRYQCLGDPTAVSVLLDDHAYGYEMRPAPRITQDMHYIHYQKERLIRWYHFIDPRFTLEDMYAKIQLHYGKQF